jgi:hypothetical protein
MTNKPITILGIPITMERFPNLYRMAERNPEGLENWLSELVKTSGSDSVESAAIILEHDLEHERLK